MTVLVSIFRDSSDYVDRYVEQVDRLRAETPVKVVAAEGDSTDDTYDRLARTDYTLLKVEHGGPYYPSLDLSPRWRQIAAVCNVAMTAAVRVADPDESVVYVESDLIWDTDTMLALIDHTTRFPAVAPLSMRGGRFYDVFGYMKNGIAFESWSPYHPSVPTDRMVRIDCAGSCMAFSPTAAAVAQFSPVDCVRGVGRSLYAAGLSLWIDPTISVEHPPAPVPVVVP